MEIDPPGALTSPVWKTTRRLWANLPAIPNVVEAIAEIVVAIRGAPPPVGAAMPLVLTRLAIARVLSIAYACVR